MYKAIKQHPPVLSSYSNELLQKGVVDQPWIDQLQDAIMDEFQQAFQASQSETAVPQAMKRTMSRFNRLARSNEAHDFGVTWDRLKQAGLAITTLPEDAHAHRVMAKLYKQRHTMIERGHGIDWGLAEQLAWATLLQEGVHVRVSGQDVERGTFSHRHAVVHDQVCVQLSCPCSFN